MLFGTRTTLNFEEKRINIKNGYIQLEIRSPRELMNYENGD